MNERERELGKEVAAGIASHAITAIENKVWEQEGGVKYSRWVQKMLKSRSIATRIAVNLTADEVGIADFQAFMNRNF